MNSNDRPEHSFMSLRGLAACFLVLIGTTVNAQTIQHFNLGADRSPIGIAAGPDGNVWLTVAKPSGTGSVEVISTVGHFVAEFPTGTSENKLSAPAAYIVPGPDDNLWYLEQLGHFNNIVRINPMGIQTRFPTACFPIGLTSGPQNSVWFTESGCADSKDRIGQIVAIASPRIPTGTTSEYPIGSNKDPFKITASPDGNLWFSEYLSPSSSVGELIFPRLDLVEFSTPSIGASPREITVGPDGDIWYTEYLASPEPATIVRLTPAGTPTKFDLPLTPGREDINAIDTGADGNLWIGTRLGNISRIEYSDGSITQTVFPAKHGAISAITSGPDGNIWFTESSAGKVGVVHLDGIFLDGFETD